MAIADDARHTRGGQLRQRLARFGGEHHRQVVVGAQFAGRRDDRAHEQLLETSRHRRRRRGGRRRTPPARAPEGRRRARPSAREQPVDRGPRDAGLGGDVVDDTLANPNRSQHALVGIEDPVFQCDVAMPETVRRNLSHRQAISRVGRSTDDDSSAAHGRHGRAASDTSQHRPRRSHASARPSLAALPSPPRPPPPRDGTSAPPPCRTSAEPAGRRHGRHAATTGPVGTIPDPAACAEGLTLEDGVLTVATGEPAFPP